MKCEECEKECNERHRQLVRIPKDRTISLKDLSPEQTAKTEMEDIEIMVCKDCWGKYDLMYKNARDFVKYEAENLMKKAGGELNQDTKKKLQKIIDEHKDKD